MERPYLSIGEVLALLKGEFPEITISKIRFLEKGGLVNPERTPSGYRKFYDADIERLRQVLRLQKEQFLPLRVIREVLDTTPTSEGPAAPDEPEVRAAPAGAPPRPSGGVVLASVATVGTSAAALVRVSPTEDGAPAAPAAPSPQPPEPARPLRTVPSSPQDPPPSEVAGRSWPVPSVGGPASASQGAQSAPPGPARSEGALGTPSPLGPTPGAAVAGAPGNGEAPRSANGKPLRALQAESGMTLTAEELCAAIGISADDLAELRHFGLVKARNLGGTEYFGEDELTVATLAARLARHGVQARHLRMYLTSAEREASFVAQLVLPYLKQRNPDARRRATETAEEVTRLGQSLRATLLKKCLEAELTF